MKINIDKAFLYIEQDAKFLDLFHNKGRDIISSEYIHRIDIIREHILDIKELLIELTEEESK